MPKDEPAYLDDSAIDRMVAARTRVVVERLAKDRARSSVAMTKERRRLFLDVLTSGGTVAQAVEAAGLSISTVYRERKRDPKFAEAWAVALEASCGPIEELLLQTAMYAPLESMARVRAAESLLGARSAAYRKGGGGAAVTMKRGADGDSLTLALGTPLPD